MWMMKYNLKQDFEQQEESKEMIEKDLIPNI